MARLARIVIPDVPHHVTQRGNRRLPIFFPMTTGRLILRWWWRLRLPMERPAWRGA